MPGEYHEDECGVVRKSEYCNPSSRRAAIFGGSQGAFDTQGGQGRQTRAVNLEDDDVLGQPTGPLKRARDVKTDVRLASHLPFVIFVLLLVLFTVWYQSMPVLPWFAAAIFADVLLVGAYPQRATAGFKERTRWDWFPLMCCLLALGAGISLGIQNSTIVEPWMHAHYLRTYSNVNPDADPKMYVDAGVVHFAVGTKLDIGSSAGYLSWPHTYCAAPIVAGGGSETQARAGFWAVGVNCCSAHGDFTCDSAGNADAKSGLRIESHHAGEPGSGTSHFDLAVKKAAAFYGKDVSEQPVYVLWQADPAQTATHHLIAALCFIAFNVAVAACGCFASRRLLFQVDQQQQKQSSDLAGQRRPPPQFGTRGP